jgi:hypothetical protein
VIVVVERAYALGTVAEHGAERCSRAPTVAIKETAMFERADV